MRLSFKEIVDNLITEIEKKRINGDEPPLFFLCNNCTEKKAVGWISVSIIILSKVKDGLRVFLCEECLNECAREGEGFIQKIIKHYQRH